MIFGKTEEKYFYAEGWTRVMGLRSLGKIGVLGQQQGANKSRNWLDREHNAERSTNSETEGTLQTI
jgi:hypothetical protein